MSNIRKEQAFKLNQFASKEAQKAFADCSLEDLSALLRAYMFIVENNEQEIKLDYKEVKQLAFLAIVPLSKLLHEKLKKHEKG